VVVRRLRPIDQDLAKIVEQINSASMEIDEPFTQDCLTEFLADDRNVYLTVHIDGQLAGTLHAIGYLHPAGQRYCTWMRSTPTRRSGDKASRPP